MHLLKDPHAMDQFLQTQNSLLHGKRNFINRLWDITLASNKNIPHNSIILPRSYERLYPTHQDTISQQQPLRQKRPGLLAAPPFNKVFQVMEPLISIQECNHIVENQLKTDRLSAISKQYQNPFQSLNALVDENVKDSCTKCQITYSANVFCVKIHIKQIW